jgi:hypothetical protein
MVMTGKTRIFWKREFFEVHMLTGRLKTPSFFGIPDFYRILQQICPLKVPKLIQPVKRSAMGVNHGGS